MSSDNATSEIELFLCTLQDGSAVKRKWAKGIDYRRGKGWTDAAILQWINGENIGPQAISHNADESVMVSPESIETVDDAGFGRSSTAPMEDSPLPIVMSGTDGGSYGVVLDRAHLFAARKTGGVVSRNSISKIVESPSAQDIRQTPPDPSQVSPFSGESIVAQDIRQTPPAPSQVSPVSVESIVAQDIRQTPPAPSQVSPVSGESIMAQDIRQTPLAPSQVSPVSVESPSSQDIRQTPPAPSQVSPAFSVGWDFARAPYWIVSSLCAVYLIHSMAGALGGGFWSYCIASAFDITPILLVGARVSDKKTQQTAMLGAVIVFVIGLSLYLAPHVQTLTNELTTYSEKSGRYASDVKDYESKLGNKQALIDESKSKYDTAVSDYKAKLEAYGDKNWRTNSAKQRSEKLYADWKAQSKDSDSIKKPEAPVYTDGLRSSVQELLMRVGLFSAAFLLMYVMRRLDPVLSDN